MAMTGLPQAYTPGASMALLVAVLTTVNRQLL